MIAYLQLPSSSVLVDQLDFFAKLQGVERWEVDSPASTYLQLEPWMKKQSIRHLYQALRSYFGPLIRFGAAEQKTTARAAALYRPVPHATIITPELTEAFLAELPISLLPGLGRRTARYLKRQGITTFSAFRRLPSETLKEWFGVSGLILQQFAQGIDPRSVERRQRFVPATAASA
ncbi:MAG: hypothetical protein HY092_04240 [Candidatus Kerfeldbacteria bacterium]|nr:hypothetical protein [Candidatus Kerfeldbacteria bacterium]